MRVTTGRVLDSRDEKTDTGTDGSGLETLLDGGLGVIDNMLRRHDAFCDVKKRCREIGGRLPPKKTLFSSRS
jgi:hypothetical protein